MQKNFTDYGLPDRYYQGAGGHQKLTAVIWKIMKISMVQVTMAMVFAALAMANDNFAQRVLDREVSVKVNNVTLEKALRKIESATDVKFVYSRSHLKLDDKVTLSFTGESLGSVLEQLLAPREIEYRVQATNDFIVLTREPTDETNTTSLEMSMLEPIPPLEVSGLVTDPSGLPVPGVSILVKGTTTGTVTDVEGRYKLTVPDENAVLVFSSIGHTTQEIPVNGRNEINISLVEDVQNLEEIVVVGYGSQKKSVVTGAISSVKADDFENQQIARVEQALQGRTSGLTIASSSGAPGAEATVRIRGATSLNEGASDPLYVVDGVVVSIGRIDYLNPSDIESIEVLKDAASAAIYGARSSAGVILVTTKKGREGGLQINYNGYYGTQAPAKKLDLLNARQYATLINEQEVNAGNAPVYADPQSLGEGTDWQELIFNNNARIQNHEISISGGSDKSTFYTSFGLFDQEGIVATEISGFKRHNFRLNSTHKLRKWLTIGQTLGYSHIKTKGGVAGNTDFGGPLSGAIMLDPLTPIVIEDPAVANQVPYSTQAVVRDELGRPYGISQIVQQQVTNPLAYIQTRRGNHNWTDDLIGNVFLEAEPLSGLKFRSSLGARLSYGGRESFSPIFYLNSNQESTQTSFNRTTNRSLNWNLENTLSYSRSVDQHNFEILLGQGAYLDNRSIGLDVTYFNIPVNTFEDASLNYDVATEDIKASGTEGIEHTISSLFGRITYNYAEKYLFTGILRRDGSSRFGPNNKYGYFPSASVGWVTSQEGFWPTNRAVNFLKIRGSYGITGNDVLGNFRYLSTVGDGRNYTFGNDNYLIGYSPDAPANPDLRWEETSQLNIGFDAAIFENWSLSFDWYNKVTDGILQTVTLPKYVGATGSPYGNVADMKNTGVELELGYRKDFGELHLDLRGNISHLRNEVTYLGDEKEFLENGAKIQSSTYFITRTAVGHAIGSFYGFKTQGIFQNQSEVDNYLGPEGLPIQPNAQPGDFRWADLNGDGEITEEDRTFIGDPTPDWSYGFTFNAAYRGFDLLIFGQGVSGNQIFQGLRRMDIPTANWQTSALERWTGEGTTESYPRLTVKDTNKNFAHPSEFHLQDGNYFRIKTLQIGYSLPKSLISEISMVRARVYVSSNNLVTFTKYTGFDPEIGGDDNDYSIDRAIYPQARSFILGLNVGF